MSGTFYNGITDHTVSNLRFSNLFEWVISSSKKINENNASTYIEKMEELSECVFIPHTFVKFQDNFEEELEFWSKAFFQLGHDIFNGEVGNHDNRMWQPSAIGDAMFISKMIKELSNSIKKNNTH